MMPASPSLDRLRKAAHGEGSRGGKIIGHFKSGRPKYATDTGSLKITRQLKGLHKLANPMETIRAMKDKHFAHYSKADHRDLHRIYSDKAGQLSRKATSLAPHDPKYKSAHRVAARMRNLAQLHAHLSRLRQKGFEPTEMALGPKGREAGSAFAINPHTHTTGKTRTLADEYFPGMTSADHERAAKFHRERARVSDLPGGHHNVARLHEAAAKIPESNKPKIPGHTRFSDSGTSIAFAGSARYNDMTPVQRTNDPYASSPTHVENGRKLIAAFPEYTAGDHISAANHHDEMAYYTKSGRDHDAAQAHGAAARILRGDK